MHGKRAQGFMAESGGRAGRPEAYTGAPDEVVVVVVDGAEYVKANTYFLQSSLDLWLVCVCKFPTPLARPARACAPCPTVSLS